jgi:hypothetical protein
MNSKAFHHSEASRNSSVTHQPHDHMHTFRHQRDKVPKVSCAEAACGISLSGSGFTAWIRSGNLMAS